MKLSYARAAVFVMASTSLLPASTCMPKHKVEEPPPAIEAPARPERPETPAPAPRESPRPPENRPRENPDGGAPEPRERPSPHNPLHEELQTRLARR